MKLATRHECSLRYFAGWMHEQETGKPKRKRSRCCGSAYRTETGLYGLFLHSSASGSATYRQDEALSLHRTHELAELAADSDGRSLDDLAIRWVAIAE